VLASEGLGVIAVPAAIESAIRERYGLHRVGEAEGCIERFFAIAVERRLKHPAVVAICNAARDQLFA